MHVPCSSRGVLLCMLGWSCKDSSKRGFTAFIQTRLDGLAARVWTCLFSLCLSQQEE